MDEMSAYTFLQDYGKKIASYETCLFPIPVFTSTGIIAEESECSICGKKYGTCDHILGFPYMGQMCYEIVTKIKKIDHIAVVKSPADKGARITSYE